MTTRSRFERRLFILAIPPALRTERIHLLEEAFNDALIHLFTLRPVKRLDSALSRACYNFWREEWPEPPFNPNNYQEVYCYLLSDHTTLMLSMRSQYL